MPDPVIAATGDTKLVRAGAIVGLIEGAESIGIETGKWFPALGLTVEELERRGARVSWDTLVDALESVERLGVSPDDFERMGAAISRSPHLIVQRFAGFFVRPEHILYVGVKWVGPLLFPMLMHEVEYRGHEISLRLEVPSGLRGCKPYFHICRGTMASVPELIGEPKARVVAEISSHVGVFHFTCVRGSTGAGRMRRIARAVLSAPRMIEVLAEQERAIRRGLEQLIRHEDDFRRVLDALPDAVIVYAGERILYVNPRLPHLLGYDERTALDVHAWSDLVSSADCVRVVQPQREAEEFYFVCRGSRPAILELSRAHEILFEGEQARLVVARDVTARREIQNQMAIADRLSSLGTLSAGIAHEINNPLTLILSNLELAGRVCNRECTTDAVGYLGAAREGAERVRAITRDLHMFAQPEEEVAALVDVGDVVRSTVALATGQVRTRASLHTEIGDVPQVLGNRSKLGQVLLNLVINALQALPDRPASENEIVVRLLSLDDRVVIEVGDNGVGIPEQARTRLFEPFFSTKLDTSGTGLGLAVAHGIVVSMDGDITFESEAGTGTVFRVSLPAARTGDAAPVSAPEPRDASARGGRVLVVDDEAALREIVGDVLSGDGLEVVLAGSGDEALEILRDDGVFDVIVCDLMMPHGSGVDVYRYLETHRPDHAARVVFMTGGVYRDEVREFLAGVDNQCLQKPFSLDELCAVVGEFVA